ncbi:Ribosomal RNA-processing protein 12 [Smittium mucronatum]|uniref:Ribosomal RNA-processing protein 12 n=1 Tax=Smittium mucronatum TaxID=133383 RepID=A0A1R0GX65_9FUNG|nr:Ribosomal RNA-processing protein 12 [Smittium mucronatum]
MTLLDQNKEADLNFTGPVIYILAAILPFATQSIIQAQFSKIMAILSTSLDLSNADPMTLRSVLTCLENLLKVQDLRVWNQPTAQKSLQSVFILGLDSRPKVRRRAQEVASNILLKIPPPMIIHPMANAAVDFILTSLEESSKDHVSTVHILQFMSSMFKSFPPDRIEKLSNVLLALLKMNNPYIYSEVLKCFEKLFESIDSGFDKDLFFELLNSIISQRPNVNDASLSASWLTINKLGFEALYRLNPELCEQQIPSVFEMTKPYIELGKPEVKQEAIDCMEAFVSKCIREGSNCSKEVSSRISSSLIDCLGYRFRDSWASMFYIISLLAIRLGKSSRPSMDQLLEFIAKMRMEKGFDLKKEADDTLGNALSSMGPKLFLELLPLNIEASIPGMENNSSSAKKKSKSSENPESEGRAWILPIMNGYIKNVDISFFKNNLLPLADKLDFYSTKLQSNGRAIQSKVVSVLSIQIWSLLGGFFDSPSDIIESIDEEFVDRILNQLIEVPELRPSLCTSLNTLVKQVLKKTSVINLDTSIESDVKAYNDQEFEYAIKSKEHISKFSSKILSTLFTLIADTPAPKSRYIHETAAFQLKIIDKADIFNAFKKVLNMLFKALQSHKIPTAAESSSKYLDTNPQPPVYSMLDIIGTLAPFLNEDSIFSSLDIMLPLLSQPEDVILQKKTYKVIGLFASSLSPSSPLPSANQVATSIKFVEKVLPFMISSAQFASPLSRRNRLNLLSLTTHLLPNTELHIVPLFLSEAIIGTKDVNEKSRLTAFELLDALAQKMILGGDIDPSKLKNDEDLEIDEGKDKVDSNNEKESEKDEDIIEDEESENVQENETQLIKSASIGEYFEMVIAGLAAKTPYMISATITSLAYLLNSYSDQLSPDFITSLLNTILLFVNSNSREIAKASLGFVKVAVLVLPKEFLIKALDDIVKGVLKWANEHKARFSLKSRHIIERLVRRVGVELVEASTPEEHKKLIANIKKRKMRAKRGKSLTENSKDLTKENSKPQESSDDGGDSDSSESDFFEKKDSRKKGHAVKPDSSKPGGASNARQGQKSWIVEDDIKDDPLDFLSQTAFSQLSFNKPSKNLKKEDFKKHVPTTKDGKFIFEEEDDEPKPENNKIEKTGQKDEDSNYYMEMIDSKDGFSRGMNNKIKFNKRKSQDDDFGDEDKSVNQHKHTNEKKSRKEYGSEFKSKNGRGDVKKKGKLDPYAYIPMDPKLLSSKSGSKLNTMSKSKKNKRHENRK